MKKLLLSLSFILFIMVGTQAQTKFGLRTGVGFPSYNYSDSENISHTTSITRFHAGVFLETHIASYFYFHPEVSLQGKGSKFTESTILGGGEIIQKTTWLDFPLNVIGKVLLSETTSVFAGTGPYVGFTMDATNTYPSGAKTAVIIYDDNPLKNYDYGVNFIAGFEFAKRFSLTANYRIGIANILEDKSYKWSDNFRNKGFSMSVGASL